VESPQSSNVGGLLAFLILLVLGGGGIALYHGADDSGWIPRTRDVEMYMRSDWYLQTSATYEHRLLLSLVMPVGSHASDFSFR
jgi:hypothetical protein